MLLSDSIYSTIRTALNNCTFLGCAWHDCDVGSVNNVSGQYCGVLECELTSYMITWKQINDDVHLGKMLFRVSEMSLSARKKYDFWFEFCFIVAILVSFFFTEKHKLSHHYLIYWNWSSNVLTMVLFPNHRQIISPTHHQHISAIPMFLLALCRVWCLITRNNNMLIQNAAVIFHLNATERRAKSTRMVLWSATRQYICVGVSSHIQVAEVELSVRRSDRNIYLFT